MKNYMNLDIPTTPLQCTSLKNTNIIRITPLNSSSVTGRKEKGRVEEKYIGRWTRKEHKAFIKGRLMICLGLINYGKQWKLLQKSIPSRTIVQIRTHAQKFFIKLGEKLPKETDLLQYLRKMTPESLSSLVNNFYDSNSKHQSSSFPSIISSIFPLIIP